MGLITNLLGQPSGRSTCGRLQGKKAERTIIIFSAGKGNNKKRNRQIFLTVSALLFTRLRMKSAKGPDIFPDLIQLFPAMIHQFRKFCLLLQQKISSIINF